MKKLLLALFVLSSSLLALKAQIINTIVGNGIAGYSGDGGLANDAEIWSPSGVFVDKVGNIFISDGLNNRIRKVNTAGIITTIAGNGYNPGGFGGYSGDGGPATDAELYNPQSICTDPIGSVYIADYGNNRIRKVDTGGIISTIAGNGHGAFSGDGGAATACELWAPASICFDTASNMYIADAINKRIRKINTSGIIITVAGGGLNSVTDGVSATTVQLGEIYGVSVNDSGNVYLSSSELSQIFKVNPSGDIYIIAGMSTIGYSGDGGPAIAAELGEPCGLCADNLGNVYFGDGVNNRIRLINEATGIITTVAGDSSAGFSGDGGAATDAELNIAYDVFVDAFNNLYIADYYNYRVREVTGITTTEASLNNYKTINLFPNPATDKITITLSGLKSGLTSLSIIDISGREIIHSQLSIVNSQSILDISALSSGIYFAKVSIDGQQYTVKFIKILKA